MTSLGVTWPEEAGACDITAGSRGWVTWPGEAGTCYVTGVTWLWRWRHVMSHGALSGVGGIFRVIFLGLLGDFSFFFFFFNFGFFGVSPPPQ